ncbi:MAG: hypothetical protein IJR70_02020 [Eubacterium sp.]|nr:hypothetical protein [Eubacterium sp.]
MKLRKTLCVLIALIIPIASFAVSGYASGGSKTAASHKTDEIASVSSKDEVVYASLDNNGEPIEAYVVNILNVKEKGNFTDFGTYSSVENLTSTEKLVSKNASVSGWAEEGKFYYQGNISHAKLPWIIDINYYLNGNEITADNLSGKSGELKINIKTSKAPNISPEFYKHYLLQISITLSTLKCTDIQAKGATIANAGTDKQINFTALPNKKSDNTLTAKIKDFSMGGIGINAVPYNMEIDMPDTSEMTGGFSQLSDGIEQLDGGVAKLKDGAKQLTDGSKKLSDGSTQIMNGLEQLNFASDQIVQGSKEIKEALRFIAKSLNESLTDEDIQKLKDIYEEMEDLNKILKEVPEVLDGMSSTTTALYNALKVAVDAIPDNTVTSEQIADLYEKNPGNEALGTLVQTYYAAQTVKSTFDALGPALESSNNSMSSTMRILSTEINTLSKQVDELLKNKEMIEQLKELRSGMQLLADNYKTFDSGLRQFTNGLSTLADNYSEFDAGISDMSDGMSQYESGVKALKKGTAQLYNGTKDLPEVVENAINSMTAEYDHSDFKPVSYTSEKNENINAVQFVFSTKPIAAKSKEDNTEKDEEKEISFIQRVVNLIKKLFKTEGK